ncbi:MAG TPA: GNAT family protein [Actinoplanes sp.]|nr:GNAT family protein [Actinoplanes sp.]
MTCADFRVKPTLAGDRVVLRPFTPGDVAALLEAMADPETARLTGSRLDPVADEEHIRHWYATRNAQPDRLDLAVVDRAGGRCVGEAVLHEWDEANHSCTFRILIGPRGRGRGLGTEATRLIVGYGFESLRLHRVSLEVYAFNPRARYVYEKVGFRAEGVLRDALRTADGWVDATVMSVLSHEWPPAAG